MFDRAFDEFRDSALTGDDSGAVEQDSSKMIGIVSRLGGGKRALAVGLGSGGAAGEVVPTGRTAVVAVGAVDFDAIARNTTECAVDIE